MPRKTTSLEAVATIGIDIGKNTFHLIGLDKMGAIVLRQKLSRSQIDARLANMPPCLIGMEACVGAHHLRRELPARADHRDARRTGRRGADLRRDHDGAGVRPRAGNLAGATDGRPWGVSEEIGAVSAFPRSGEESYSAGATSQHTLELIDDEVRRILTECAEEAQRTLTDHRERLDHLAQALLERETLDEADAYAVAGIARPSAAKHPVAAQA